MPDHAVTIRIGADDLASPVFNQVGGSFEKMLDVTKAGAKGGGGGGGGSGLSDDLKALKDIAGARSALGEMGQLVKGGGIVAGATLLAGAIGQAADRATVLKDQFNSGKISAGELIGQIGLSLPVLGSITGAFISIRELMTGEKSVAAEMTREAELQNKLVDAQVASLRKAEEGHKAILALVRDIQDRTKLIGLDEKAKTEELLRQAQIKEREKIQGEAGERKSAAAKPLDDAMEKLKQEQILQREKAAKLKDGADAFVEGGSKEHSVYKKDFEEFQQAQTRVEQLDAKMRQLKKQQNGAMKALDADAAQAQFASDEAFAKQRAENYRDNLAKEAKDAAESAERVIAAESGARIASLRAKGLEEQAVRAELDEKHRRENQEMNARPNTLPGERDATFWRQSDERWDLKRKQHEDEMKWLKETADAHDDDAERKQRWQISDAEKVLDAAKSAEQVAKKAYESSEPKLAKGESGFSLTGVRETFLNSFDAGKGRALQEAKNQTKAAENMVTHLKKLLEWFQRNASTGPIIISAGPLP